MIRVHFLRCSFYTQKKYLVSFFSVNSVPQTSELPQPLHSKSIRNQVGSRPDDKAAHESSRAGPLLFVSFAHALFCFVILIMIVGG